MKTQVVNLRIEELPTVARIVLQSFKVDRTDFETFSPRFNAQFVTDYDGLLTQMTNLVEGKLKIGQIKLATQNIYKGMDDARPFITRLENYARMASGLDSLIDGFRFKQARERLGRKDAEGFLAECYTMLGNVNNNFDALNAEGYTETEKINFNALLDKIDSDNLNQIELNKEKERIVKDNKELINNMKKMISLINNTGKALYKYTNYEKTNEYTLTKIMHRVRNAMSKDESTKEYKTFIEGVASDFVTEEPMANVKVSVEGTNVSAVTKADGSFRLALPDGGTVTIVAEIDKYSQYRDEMEITANETNLVDIEMEPIEEEIV